MNRFSILSSASLSLVLGACGGASEGGDSANDGTQQELRRVSIDPGDVLDPAPAPPVVVRPPPVFTVPPPVATVVYDPGPPNADLRPDGAMRYYGPAQPTLGLQIDVVNVGTTPATGAAGRVSIAGSVFNVALYQYYGGTASAPNTVNPGERGYLKADVPPNFLALCGAYQVQIDLDHTLQAGTNVFANDTRSVLAYETGGVCRLNWSTPINGATLGQEPDAHEAGKSLQDIVSSIEVARVDGNRCSTCHNSGTNPASSYVAAPYRPNVAPGVASAPIDPFMFIGGNEGWACGGNPWASQFIAVPDNVSYSKPKYLKDAFRKWLSDGGMR
jgi:hypothetical protein